MLMRMARLALLLGLAGCVLPPLDWSQVGAFHVPFDRSFEVCKEVAGIMGFAIEQENEAEGEIETDWRMHKTLVGGQGYREFVKFKLYKRQGGFTEIWVMAIRQDNENPGGATSNPETAHWGIEDNSPTTESQAKLLLQKHLRDEANR